MDLISKNPCLIIPDPHGFFLSLTYLSFFFNIYETLFTTQTPRRETYYLIIPELSEPPVRILGATIPENESHIFR